MAEPRRLEGQRLLGLVDLRALERLQGTEINEAKKALAFEATRLCHGVDAAEAAAAAARAVFEGGSGVENLPVVRCDAARLEAGMPVIELFMAAGLAASNGEA